MDSIQARRDYLQAAYTWADTHCTEAIKAIYCADRDTALVVLAAAAEQLPGSGLPAELLDMVGVRIRYMRWQAERIGCSASEVTRLRQELIAELQQHAGDVYGTGVARCYLLQLRTIDERDHGMPYPVEDFHADLEAIPSELRTKELLLYFSAWAFLHSDMALIEECFGVYTVESEGFMADFLWQRANLMYQLLKDRATSRDVIELIRRVEHPNQWHDVEMIMLPTCIRRGLLDDEACQALGKLLQNHNAYPPQMPPRRVRTTHIRHS
jgi:hypothetical protein